MSTARRRLLLVLIGTLAGLGIADLLLPSGSEVPPARAAGGLEAVEQTPAAAPLERPAAVADDPPIPAEPSAAAMPTATPEHPPAGFAGARAATRPAVPRAELDRRIGRLLAHQTLQSAGVGVVVRSLTTGDLLVDRFGKRPLVPASNTKLLTTAAALDLLGPDFQFETRVRATGEVLENGVLAGDLVIEGDGDPDPVVAGREPLLARLVAAVVGAGIRRVEGRLIVDDRVFDREHLAPEWKPTHARRSYGAPVAGLTLFGNVLRVEVEPAALAGAAATVRLVPGGDVFRVRPRVETAAADGRHLIHLAVPVAPGDVTVTGSTPLGGRPYPLEVPIDDPVRATALVLQDALARAGVPVAAGVVVVEPGAAPAAGTVLARVRTPLADVLKVMNKDSSNVVAEHVYKRAGHALEGTGTFAAGGRAVLHALRRYGVDPAGAASVDGSGLSRGNRITARQLTDLLAALHDSPARAVFLASLPIAGVDGTLQNRLTEPAYQGRARAKTGFIERVSALSGYAETGAGEVLAFAILMNDFDGWNSTMKSIQDGIVRLLCDLAAP